MNEQEARKTADSIKNIAGFMKATMQEFMCNNPNIYSAFCLFVGKRVTKIQDGSMNESDYIAKWKETYPGPSE